MPAMLEDPTAPVIYRTSGAPPYPTPLSSDIPSTISARQVTLRDRITIASLLPFSTPSSIPPRLLSYLCQQLNLEIEKGDTYPMISPMPESTFGTYWFQNFGAVMILGSIGGQNYVEEVWRMEETGVKWEECALGSFYVKPNYPGRSSHVSNGGFLVTEAARNKGVGRLMGEGYLEWAPRLGYTYSVFNLVYETNVASCRIWDALGFKRIGRVKACGNLRSHPNALVDAIMYGRDLGPEGEDFVSEERFDKIRFYLKHGKYPNGADRAEKSRLRSAATHYKLLPAEDGREGDEDGERLMLRDKEVISDAQRQYEIARVVHVSGQHGGINKTTATIAEKYHWVRIKETVSLVIRNCADCKDTAKLPVTPGRSNESNGHQDFTHGPSMSSVGPNVSTGSNHPGFQLQPSASMGDAAMYDRLVDFAESNNAHTMNQSSAAARGPGSTQLGSNGGNSGTQQAPMAHMGTPNLSGGPLSQYADIPLDPQIMAVHAHSGHHQHQHHHQQAQHGYPMHGEISTTSPPQQMQQQQQHHHLNQPRPHESDFFIPQPHHHLAHHVHHHQQQQQSHPTPLPSSPSTHSPYPHHAPTPQPPLHGHSPHPHAEDPHKQPDYPHQHQQQQHQHHPDLNRLTAYDRHGGGGGEMTDVGRGNDNSPFDVDMADGTDHDAEHELVDDGQEDQAGLGSGSAQVQGQGDVGAGVDEGDADADADGDADNDAEGDDTRLATDRHIIKGDDPLRSR